MRMAIIMAQLGHNTVLNNVNVAYSITNHEQRAARMHTPAR